jgi:hypothetical protein
VSCEGRGNASVVASMYILLRSSLRARKIIIIKYVSIADVLTEIST